MSEFTLELLDLNPLLLAEMPEAVQAHLRADIVACGGREPTLDETSVLRFEGVDSYVVVLPIENATAEEMVFVVDTTNEGDVMGEAVLAIEPNSADLRRRRPYVGYSETSEAHRRQGLGMRRLRLMNELAQRLYGDVLHSNPMISAKDKAAVAVWKNLVAVGEAKDWGRTISMPHQKSLTITHFRFI